MTIQLFWQPPVSTDELRLTIMVGMPDDPRVDKVAQREREWKPKYNGAPRQEHWVFRQGPNTPISSKA